MLEMLPVPEAPKPEGSTDIRVLTPEEIESVRYVFEGQGASLPDPAISTFIGAVKDGKVLAFLVLQLKLHAQPMWIEQGHSELFAPVVARAEKHILTKCGPQWVYLFAPAGRLSQLAQSMGMGLEPWVVLSKLVTPPIPTAMTPFELLVADNETEVQQ